jgi:hypothetical protein
VHPKNGGYIVVLDIRPGLVDCVLKRYALFITSCRPLVGDQTKNRICPRVVICIVQLNQRPSIDRGEKVLSLFH